MKTMFYVFVCQRCKAKVLPGFAGKGKGVMICKRCIAKDMKEVPQECKFHEWLKHENGRNCVKCGIFDKELIVR